MQLCSSDDLGLLQHLLCRCSFPIKYVNNDSMVNKKIKNIYIYNVCVRERESERESIISTINVYINIYVFYMYFVLFIYGCILYVF